jgi:hypothetical protein
VKRDQWRHDLMVEWLQDRADHLPVASLEAAVAYARAHPRRRFSFVGMWRSAMTRLNLTEVTSVTRRRRPFGAFGAVAVVAVAVVALVGAATLFSGNPWDQPGAIGPNATPTPTLTPPTESSLAVELPVPATVTADSVCSTLKAGTESAAGDVTQYRGVELRCTGKASDPRLDGTTSVAMSIDERPDGSADIWGTGEVVAAGGSWRGSWRGTVDVGYTRHRLAGVYIGTGDHEGLRVRWTQTGGPSTFCLAGTLERASTIPPDGSRTVSSSRCVVAGEGTETIVDGVTQVRELNLKCTGDVSDPRVDGPFEVTVNIDEIGDQSADLRGTSRISMPNGSWEGSWTGTVAVGYTTHRMEGVLAGSGAYTGLEYRWTQIGEDPYIISGTIGPAE